MSVHHHRKDKLFVTDEDCTIDHDLDWPCYKDHPQAKHDIAALLRVTLAAVQKYKTSVGTWTDELQEAEDHIRNQIAVVDMGTWEQEFIA